LADKQNLAQQVKTGLEEWAGKEAHSSKLMRLVLDMLDIQAEVAAAIGALEIKLEKSEIDRRLSQGKALVLFEELELDWTLLLSTFHRLAILQSEQPGIMEPVPPGLARIDEGTLRGWVKDWLEGEAFSPKSGIGEVSPLLLANLVQQAMQPFLTAYAQAFKGKFYQDDWRRGYCPICGSEPNFAYLEQDAGARWLVCSSCSFEWRHQRMECPYCGNREHTSLLLYTSDDGAHRLHLCGKCRRYLKAVDLRKLPGEHLMPLLALTTLNMDKRAEDLGYFPYSQMQAVSAPNEDILPQDQTESAG
jgi:FdhE protein